MLPPVRQVSVSGEHEGVRPAASSAHAAITTGRQVEPVNVFARWAGSADAQNDVPEAKLHIYSTSIPPETPLELGMRVRLLATTPAWYLSPEVDPDIYDAYDAHVVGTITGIAGWKGRKVVLRVANECAVNPVKTVKIRIPFAPEATVRLNANDVPAGRREAHETDLNTEAVVRTPPVETLCGARECRMPWRNLVGENFLSEPMEDDIAERTGALGGRRSVPTRLVSWEEVAANAARYCVKISY